MVRQVTASVPTRLPPVALPGLFIPEEANGGGRRVLGVARLFWVLAVARFVVAYEIRVGTQAEPLSEGFLDDGAAALPRALTGLFDGA